MFKFLKNIIGMGKTKEMYHPYFGHLLFFKSTSPQRCYWEGSKTIDEQTASITIHIHAKEIGPSPEQERFFKKIVSNLDSLVLHFSDLVKPHFETWCQKDYADHFLKEFECTGLHIPINGNEKNEWEITFARISDQNFVFIVFFENGVAVNTDLDS
jgi:hypothetical protein